jgi:hypothetical protein
VAGGGVVAPPQLIVPGGALTAVLTVEAGPVAAQAVIDISSAAGSVRAVLDIVEGPTGSCLLISEYVEGSSNNKALELVNCGSDPLDLAGYVVGLQMNDGGEFDSRVPLSGTLAAGAVTAICNPSAVSALLTRCATTHASINFNGDDRIALFRDLDGNGNHTLGEPFLDVFGQLGVRPGSAIWGERTYRRCNPEPCNGQRAFVVGDYYTTHPADTFDGIGLPPDLSGCGL